MSSNRYGFDGDQRAVAQPPFAAYLSLLVRIAGVVIVSGFLVWGLPKPAWFYRQPKPPYRSIETIWGVDVVQPFFSFLFEFFVSRVTSPFVLGTVVVAGVLALTFEYRRRRAKR